MKIGKVEVFEGASKPWSGGTARENSMEFFIPGSDPPEAISFCQNCTREKCVSRCPDIRRIIREARKREKEKEVKGNEKK